MIIRKHVLISVLLLITFLGAGIYYFSSLGRESQRIVPKIGVVDGRLQACHSKLDCVSSSGPSGESFVALWIFEAGSDVEAWQKLVQAIRRQSGYSILKDTETYLHLMSRSTVWGIVEDVEVYWAAAKGEIHFRSSSRVSGYLGASHRQRYQEFQTFFGIFQPQQIPQ
jgi:uncharacterized protein (DUF1499 family)